MFSQYAIQIHARYDYLPWSHQLCLYDVKCGSNASRASVEVVKTTNNSDYRPEAFNHTTGSNVTYKCGLGRRFKDAAAGNAWVDELNYECLDNVSRCP